MPVIFISRGTMSGVHLLVDCLHERTGIKCISREDLVETVNQHGELANRIVETLAKATSAYDQFSHLRWSYIVLMRKALLEEIRQDNVVYHGYSGHLLVPTLHHMVKVRIEAPLNLRVTMTMNRLGYDEEAAREYITQADEHRVKWARFMYGRDIRNNLLYHINLNLGHMTLNAACGILEAIMKEAEFQASAESREKVERLYLATRVEVELVTDPHTQHLEISAAVQNGGISLIGPYIEDSEVTEVKKVAQRVPGVRNVIYTPGYAHRLEPNDQHEFNL